MVTIVQKMHSRACLILRRDLINLKRLPLKGIYASPFLENNLYHWHAKIEGLKGTIWEGGVFQIDLKFTDEYNTQPPSVQFLTIPYHPNIDPSTGIPSFNLIKERWNESLSLSSLLLSLQVLLSNPELEAACIVNHEAALYCASAPHTYKQMALDCVTASLRIEAGLIPYDCHKPLFDYPTRSHKKTQKRFQKIPFDDYHILWQGLATSIAIHNVNDKSMHEKEHFHQVHHGCLEEHFKFKYGLSKSKTAEKKKKVGNLTSPYYAPDKPDQYQNKAVDELLAWATTLDENKLREN